MQNNCVLLCSICFRVLLVATGLWVPNKISFVGSDLVEGYESMSTNAEDYRNQAVLILGKGNSAFETAQNLLGKASVVHMISTNAVRLAWQTHYVGDVRYCFPAIVTGFIANTFQPSLQDSTFMIKHKGFVMFCGLPPTVLNFSIKHNGHYRHANQ